MATIGQQLLKPESGWKRLDFIDTNTNLEFSNNFIFLTNRNDAFGHTFAYLPTGVINGYVKFNFVGSKIRIIAVQSISRAKNSSIIIDGIIEEMPYMYNVNVDTQLYTLVYEKSNLTYCEHSVLIKSGTNGSYSNLHLDAMDIDSTGELKPYNEKLHKYLIKQNNQYYSIKPEFYSEESDSYIASIINESDISLDKFEQYGLDDLSLIHSNALLKLIDNKYNIVLLK